MENVTAGMQGKARLDIFSEADPLAPCNKADEKYRWQCYINHAGYLMHIFRNNVSSATAACLDANEKWIGACLQSVGLMATNPVWQRALFADASSMTNEQAAWGICKLFPRGWQNQCVIGGVDNIMNFDEFDVTRAQTFCDLVDVAYRSQCYISIGSSLRNQATDMNIVRAKCGLFDIEMQNVCLRGAGI